MKPEDTTRTVISNAVRRRSNKQTQEVVYKTYTGKHKGKPLFKSQTRHELVKSKA